MTTRKLLSALEAALPYIPAGDARFLAEDTIADARHALSLPPLPEANPPECGQRCGACARCLAEDAWVEELNATAEARLAEFTALADECRQCRTPLSPFGIDAQGRMPPVFDESCATTP